MKHKILATGLVTLLIAGAESAAQVGNQFRLDLSLVARRGNPATGIEDINDPVVIQNTERVRLEVRYRIADLVANDVASRGLRAAFIGISNDRGAIAGRVERSTLTRSQLNPAVFTPTNSGALNPDLSGQDDVVNTGMVEPLRGFIGNNNSANGSLYAGGNSLGPPGLRMDGLGFAILPQTLAAPGHQSWIGSAGTNIRPANTDTNPATWAIYSFDYIPDRSFVGNITFKAEALPELDQVVVARFAFFSRTGTNSAPIGEFGEAATPGLITISVIPNPGIGLIGIVVASAALVRRRVRCVPT